MTLGKLWSKWTIWSWYSYEASNCRAQAVVHGRRVYPTQLVVEQNGWFFVKVACYRLRGH
jgi:hypothetical protein